MLHNVIEGFLHSLGDQSFLLLDLESIYARPDMAEKRLSEIEIFRIAQKPAEDALVSLFHGNDDECPCQPLNDCRHGRPLADIPYLPHRLEKQLRIFEIVFAK